MSDPAKPTAADLRKAADILRAVADGAATFDRSAASPIMAMLEAGAVAMEQRDALQNEIDVLRDERLRDENLALWKVAAAEQTKRAKAAEAENAKLREALKTAEPHFLNALIDLATDTPREITTQTLDGGLKLVRAAIAKAKEPGAGG